MTNPLSKQIYAGENTGFYNDVTFIDFIRKQDGVTKEISGTAPQNNEFIEVYRFGKQNVNLSFAMSPINVYPPTNVRIYLEYSEGLEKKVEEICGIINNGLEEYAKKAVDEMLSSLQNPGNDKKA